MAILGIDEVGRGPWAGPLVVGAVVLGDALDEKWDDLADSKKLTAKKRERLVTIIEQGALATGLGWVFAAELDELGLPESLKLATNRAVSSLMKFANQDSPFSEIVIDGTVNFLEGSSLERIVTVLPKADAKVKEVSAASIIAKVARDNYMKEIAKKYPEYGFDKHVGYGTAAHKAALLKYGICPEHRKSFRPVAEVLGGAGAKNVKTNKNERRKTTKIGLRAEQVVAEYLTERGHKILARNHKTKFYEIDIISATKEHIYFTEVKYRKNPGHGNPLDAITGDKKRRMAFAAESFMKLFARRLGRDARELPSPILAAAAVEGAEFRLAKWLPIEV